MFQGDKLTELPFPSSRYTIRILLLTLLKKQYFNTKY